MAETPPPLAFDTDFDAAPGKAVAVAPGVVRVTAPNPGPYTFTGTNTFLLGTETLALVDPGPDDPRHREALIAAIGGRQVEGILMTHTHRDHAGLARTLADATGAPLWCGGRHRRSRPRRLFEADPVAAESVSNLEPDRTLADGERIELGGVAIDVVATPGHCANHLCFGLVGRPELLSGDHVMGWSSTMVPVPDGSMADYLASLEKVAALPWTRYLPAHGGPVADGPGFATALHAHREARNAQIVVAVGQGTRTIPGLLGRVYPGLALNLVPAALMTLKAHVEYLAEAGRITTRRGLLGTRVGPV